MKTITCVTDLTFGDGGKGTSVQRLVKEKGAKLVIRAGGGSQCAHTVISPDGRTHTFCQFGSGTFVGAKTFYGPRAYFSPTIFDIEALRLEKKGVNNPKSLFYLHGEALITTPYHRALNRLRELARKGNVHGSCGVGIGETARIGLENPAIAIKAQDLLLPIGYLTLYFEDLRKLMWDEVKTLKGQLDTKCPIVREEVQTFNIPVDSVVQKTKEAIEGLTILDKKDTFSFLNEFDECIAEGNQGVLIDQDYGFHPYTTWSKTTSENVYSLRAEYNLSHEIKDYGVIRTFLTRHGPGPFPSEAQGLADAFVEVHNTDNFWQSKFRFGHFDPVLLQYAISINKGIDKLIVSHCDWLDCTSWLCVKEYTNMGEIPKLKYPDLAAQEKITNSLMTATPIYDTKVFPTEAVLDTIKLKLNSEIIMTSNGPEFSQYKLNT